MPNLYLTKKYIPAVMTKVCSPRSDRKSLRIINFGATAIGVYFVTEKPVNTGFDSDRWYAPDVVIAENSVWEAFAHDVPTGVVWVEFATLGGIVSEGYDVEGKV